jgi:3',5'-cyclic AMP phosphodiesterase CpdA
MRIAVTDRRGPFVHIHLIALAVAATLLSAAPLGLPNRPGSLKFAVLGDFGTGHSASRDVAAQLLSLRAQFNFEMVVTTGDNIIGDQDDSADLADKFEMPFRPLLDASVRFYASLGNHDRPTLVSYAPFNMGGQRYYSFARRNVRFFILDSNWLDRVQVDWLEQALGRSTDDWKICVFHHPLYSDGVRHGPSLELRVILEPILVRYGVDVVFSGHDHIYERLHPQKGITYFVAGAGGQSERGIAPTAATAASFDEDRSFMLVEVIGGELHFRSVTRGGVMIDAGAIRPRQKG